MNFLQAEVLTGTVRKTRKSRAKIHELGPGESQVRAGATRPPTLILLSIGLWELGNCQRGKVLVRVRIKLGELRNE